MEYPSVSCVWLSSSTSGQIILPTNTYSMSTTCKQRANTHNATQTEHPHWKNSFFYSKYSFYISSCHAVLLQKLDPKEEAEGTYRGNCLNNELCYVVDFENRFQSLLPPEGENLMIPCASTSTCVWRCCAST